MAKFFCHWSHTECGPWSYKVWMGPCPVWSSQGSILGPLLYIIYTSGLSILLAETGAQGQLYADDIQAYIQGRPANASLVVGEMGHVLGKLETWMSSNRLRLNPAKTKFMWFGTRQQLAKLNLDDLANKFPSYTFSATARDLGVLLDQELTFAPHLHRLSRDCYYQLRQLRTVARS